LTSAICFSAKSRSFIALALMSTFNVMPRCGARRWPLALRPGAAVRERRAERVLHQHRDRHRADSAGHRRNRTGARPKPLMRKPQPPIPNPANSPRFLKAASAPAAKPRPFPPGRPRRIVLFAHAANWPGFAPPRWPAFAPPLTQGLQKCDLGADLSCNKGPSGECRLLEFHLKGAFHERSRLRHTTRFGPVSG
jgi:hypothetical protein